MSAPPRHAGLFRRSVALAAFAEAAKMATQVELHTTHIRNEHAFFLFLSAILSKHPVTPEERALAAPLASGGDAAAQPVYLIGASPRLRITLNYSARCNQRFFQAFARPRHGACRWFLLRRSFHAPLTGGASAPSFSARPSRFFHVPLFPPPPSGDSHCFAAAWRGAEPGPGRAGWFAPLLVTGCKAWHLRPEETFYTKSNFFAAVGRVPKGAKVVVLFGEIDCREGLLISVQKGRYRDLQEGARRPQKYAAVPIAVTRVAVPKGLPVGATTPHQFRFLLLSPAPPAG